MSDDLAWWISVVDMPALTGLFWLIWRAKKESAESVARLRDLLETRTAQAREMLAAFKLEVAKSYASVADLRAAESRLTGHLLRIEAKLDRTAMKAEAIGAVISGQ